MGKVRVWTPGGGIAENGPPVIVSLTEVFLHDGRLGRLAVVRRWMWVDVGGCGVDENVGWRTTHKRLKSGRKGAALIETA